MKKSKMESIKNSTAKCLLPFRFIMGMLLKYPFVLIIVVVLVLVAVAGGMQMTP